MLLFLLAVVRLRPGLPRGWPLLLLLLAAAAAMAPVVVTSNTGSSELLDVSVMAGGSDDSGAGGHGPRFPSLAGGDRGRAAAATAEAAEVAVR